MTNDSHNSNKLKHFKDSNSHLDSSLRATHCTKNNNKVVDSQYSKDNSATRILLIIREICNGKDINELSLSDFDFNVSKRTFQRDIKKIKDFFIEHFAYIPMAVEINQTIDSQLTNTHKIDSQAIANPQAHSHALLGGGNHFM